VGAAAARAAAAVSAALDSLRILDVMPSDDVYELFQNGTRLLEERDFHAATVPLARARDLEPDKTSIREALGRALFSAQRYAEAVAEFEAVVERAPTNDYALFCLGRSLQQLGRHREARRPLTLACCLRPERSDYRHYRDRSRTLAA
jgi:Flp pilus assembly protein TadD